MELLLIAVVGLIGSSAVAALVSIRWQQTKHRLEKHSDAESALINQHSRLRSAIMGCFGLLRVQVQLGHIWGNQQAEFNEHLRNIAHAMSGLDEARLRMAAYAPELTQTLDELQTSAANTANLLSNMLFAPRDGVEGGIVVSIPDQQLPQVLEALTNGLVQTGNDIRVTAERVARHQDRVLWSALSWRPMVFLLVLGLLVAGTLYVGVGAWTASVQELGVVWTNEFTKTVRFVPFDQTSETGEFHSHINPPTVETVRDSAEADSSAVRAP